MLQLISILYLLFVLIKAPIPILQSIQINQQSDSLYHCSLSSLLTMKENPFLKDPYRFKPVGFQFPIQRQLSADQLFPSPFKEDSLLLDGLEAQISANSYLESEKESQRNQTTLNDEIKSRLDEAEKILSFIEGTSRPKDFQDPNLECDNSFANMSFGDSSPGSRNLRNVPMTRSIITVGSAYRDKEIPSPKLKIIDYDHLSYHGQKDKFSEKSPKQNKYEDFPEAKSQKNKSNLKKSPNNHKIEDENESNLLQILLNEQLTQFEISSQLNQISSQLNQNEIHKAQNPFVRANNFYSKEYKEKMNELNEEIVQNQKQQNNNQEIRNSKNQQTRIRRSRSHSEPNIKSKEKKPQPVIIYQQPEKKEQKCLPKNSLNRQSIINQLDIENSQIKSQSNRRNEGDKINIDSEKSISIHINDVNSSSSIFEFFKDKENRRINQNVANQISFMQEQSQKKVQDKNSSKNLGMNRSIDFNTIKSKSRPKNAVISKNNQKNVKDRLTQKFKKELDNSENLTEQRIMGKIITQNALTSFKDIVIKFVLENQKEQLQSMANEMIVCMQEIEEATNIARLQRKIMSKNLNKAKKHITALKELNIQYEKFIDEMYELHREKLDKKHQKLRGKFIGIGATIENGKIIFTEQMALEYIELKNKDQLKKSEIKKRQQQRLAELESINNPNDPCLMLLASPSKKQLFQIMRDRSDSKQELTLNFIHFRNMMFSTYLGVCLEKYTNTIPERLSLLQSRDTEIIEYMRQKEIYIPKEFVDETKKMLTHLLKIVREHV